MYYTHLTPALLSVALTISARLIELRIALINRSGPQTIQFKPALFYVEDQWIRIWHPLFSLPAWSLLLERFVLHESLLTGGPLEIGDVSPVYCSLPADYIEASSSSAKGSKSSPDDTASENELDSKETVVANSAKMAISCPPSDPDWRHLPWLTRLDNSLSELVTLAPASLPGAGFAFCFRQTSHFPSFRTAEESYSLSSSDGMLNRLACYFWPGLTMPPDDPFLYLSASSIADSTPNNLPNPVALVPSRGFRLMPLVVASVFINNRLITLWHLHLAQSSNIAIEKTAARFSKKGLADQVIDLAARWLGRMAAPSGWMPWRQLMRDKREPYHNLTCGLVSLECEIAARLMLLVIEVSIIIYEFIALPLLIYNNEIHER
ncbi:unnamed protein product [Protopolystoma xenopodis]|uniref:Uncharacterized protein n=1 Tax=Protopolystoma xenopodis TaxID=117903 RepID=A0A3S5FCT3_9PLAT|nr:unnamed protein product [Protopolystoma xenopodis]